MQSDWIGDQASGLRKLLRRAATRVVAVAGAQSGIGASSLSANLACLLARHGQEVLLLDENRAHGNVHDLLNVARAHDLLHAVRGDCALNETLTQPMSRLSLLPVAAAMRGLSGLASIEKDRLLECLSTAARGKDTVLIDCDVHASSSLSACLAPDQPLLMVVNGKAAAITASYALIKRMTIPARSRRFQIVVNKSRDAADARKLFDNLARATQRYLGLSIEYLGHVPRDGQLQQAAQNRRSVVDEFPASDAARAIAEIGWRLIASSADRESEAGDWPSALRRLAGEGRPRDYAALI
jgi:flagellar biosynthesis protein FlhG